MNKVPGNIIFNVSGCLTEDALRKYVSGNLPAGDVRRVEMHLSSCPLCSDATEGFAGAGQGTDVGSVLQDVRSGLFGNRVRNLSVLKSSGTEKKRTGRLLYLSLAASVALLISGYFVIRSIVNTSEEKQTMALKEMPAFKNNKTVIADSIQAEENESINLQGKSRVVEKVSGGTAALDKQVVTSSNIRLDEAEKTLETGESRNGYYAMPVEDNKLQDKDYSGMVDSIFTPPGALALGQVTRDITVMDGEQKNKEQMPAGTVILNGDVAKSEAGKAVAIQNAVTVSKYSAMRGAKKKEEKPIAGVAVDQNKADVPKAAAREEVNTGVDEYSKGNYPAAIDHFGQVLSRNQNDQQALYYSGMSYYFNHQYDKAIQSFEKILKNTASPYYHSAKWQIAQIYTQTNQPKEARKVLDEIIDEGGTYKQNALDAIEKLENK